MYMAIVTSYIYFEPNKMSELRRAFSLLPLLRTFRKIRSTTDKGYYYFNPPVGGGRIRPPFPCVSYEATKRVSLWQRGGLLCNIYLPGCWSKTL